jgi:hypothetical protein
VASQKDQIQSLITEIDGLLNKASPRLPWVVSGASAQQRRLLERVRNYLISIQQTSAIEGIDQAKVRRELLAHDIYFQQSPEAQPPADAAPRHPSEVDAGLTEASAQQILRAVVQEMGYLRSGLMQPLQSDVQALQQRREALVQEIRQLEAQRQGYGLGLSSANQQQLISDFLQTLMGRLQESLSQQVSQAMLVNQGQSPIAPLGGLPEATSTAFPAGSTAVPPLLNPTQRLEHVQMLQAQSDQLLINLDSTLRTVFESLERNIQAYQASLSQGVDRMHSMGQQGEMMFTALISHLAQQLGREASSFLQSNVQPGGQAVAGGAVGQPNVAAVATGGENILLTPSTPDRSPNPVDISGLITPLSLSDVGSTNPELGFPFAGTEIYPTRLGDPPAASSSNASAFPSSNLAAVDDNIDNLPEIDLDSLNLNDLDLGDLDLGEMDLQSMDALLTNEALTTPGESPAGAIDSPGTATTDLDAALKLLEQLNTELQDQSTATAAEPDPGLAEGRDTSVGSSSSGVSSASGNVDAEIKDLYESLFGATSSGATPSPVVSGSDEGSSPAIDVSIELADKSVEPAASSSPEVLIGTTSEILLTPRDSYQAYTSWTITDEDKATVQQQGGENLVLRLYNISAIDLTTHTPYSFQEFDVEDSAWNRFVPIPVSDQTYVAEVGYLTADRRWLLVAKSQPVLIPSAATSSSTEVHDATVSAVVIESSAIATTTPVSEWDNHPLLADEGSPVADLVSIAPEETRRETETGLPVGSGSEALADSQPGEQASHPAIVWNEVGEKLPPEVSASLSTDVVAAAPSEAVVAPITPDVVAAAPFEAVVAPITPDVVVAAPSEAVAAPIDGENLDQISSLMDLVGDLPPVADQAPFSDPMVADVSIPDAALPFLTEPTNSKTRSSLGAQQRSASLKDGSDSPTFSGLISEDTYIPAAPEENLLPLDVEAETESNLWLDETTLTQLSEDLFSLEGSDEPVAMADAVEVEPSVQDSPAIFDWIEADQVADGSDSAQVVDVSTPESPAATAETESLDSFLPAVTPPEAVPSSTHPAAVAPLVSAFESAEDPFDFLEESVFSGEIEDGDALTAGLSVAPVTDLTTPSIAVPQVDNAALTSSEVSPVEAPLDVSQQDADEILAAPASIDDLLAGWAEDTEPLVSEPSISEPLVSELFAPDQSVASSETGIAEENLAEAELFSSWADAPSLLDQPEAEPMTSQVTPELTVMPEGEDAGLTLENMNDLFEDLLTQEADAVSASPVPPPDDSSSEFTLTGLADLYESMAPNTPLSPSSLVDEGSRSVTLEGMENLFADVPEIAEVPPPGVVNDASLGSNDAAPAWTLDSAFGNLGTDSSASSVEDSSDADIEGKKKP